MKTSYKILFSIELQHDYYNRQAAFDDIEIVPTGISQKIMKGYRMLYRVSDNKLTVLAEADGNKPFIKIDSDISLRFLLKIKNPSFQNISALKIFDLNNKVYYFTNKSDNESGGTLYLSKPMTGHDNSEEYEVGALLQDSSNIYEAITSNIASAPPNSNWRILSPQRFPEYNSNNFFEVFSGNIVFGNSKNFEALRSIPGGSFIPLNDTNYWKEKDFVHYVTSKDLVEKDAINIEGNVFGVIDLFFNSSVSSNYSILDTAGDVKEVKYVIRFKNRITTWKYIAQNNSVTSVSDNDGIFTFNKIDSEFISNEPIPLMSVPMQNFKLIKGALTVDHLKCASSFIKPEAATKSFLSEIYLNY